MRVVNNRKANVHLSTGLVLKPGDNDVDDKVWSKALGDYMTEVFIEEGYFSLPAEPKPEPVKAEPILTDSKAMLTELSTREAFPYIKELDDIERLKSWLKVDDRSTVKSALKRRLAELEE